MPVMTSSQWLKFFIATSSLFAFFCRFLNTGFGLVIFFPIYLILVIFHFTTISANFGKIAHSKKLQQCLLISQLCFVCFFLLSTDVGDSTGGITIFVALEQLGVKGLPAPAYGNYFLLIDLALAAFVILLDLSIIIISIRSRKQMRRLNTTSSENAF